MKIKIAYLMLLMLTFKFALSQRKDITNTDCSSETTLFSNGICLKNKGVKIPWNINYTELKKYGYNEIDTAKSGGVSIFWDSTIVFNDIQARFFIHTNKKYLSRNAVFRASEFCFIVNRSDMQKVIDCFNNYLGCGDCYHKEKTFYSWKIDGCTVRLQLRNNKKIDFLSDKNQFWIAVQQII